MPKLLRIETNAEILHAQDAAPIDDRRKESVVHVAIPGLRRIYPISARHIPNSRRSAGEKAPAREIDLSGNEIARALISMMARSPRSNQRPDTLMQDRSPLTRQNLLATHGRTIHSGHSRRSDGSKTSPKCPLCINTDRKFWALGFVAMCQSDIGRAYSITSSAVASSDGGTVRPSIRAVSAVKLALELLQARERLSALARGRDHPPFLGLMRYVRVPKGLHRRSKLLADVLQVR